jgi:outer membrane protein assembly factor BamB
MKTRFTVFFLFCSLFLFNSCKKDKGNTEPATKLITSFSFSLANNSNFLTKDAYGTIHNDSIIVSLPEGTNITTLRATFTYKGLSIDPDPAVARDYSTPVIYTITGSDGTIKKYVVVIRFLSTSKSITSFIFKAADNPSVSKDVTGIIGNDTIKMVFTSVQDLTLTSFTPTIVHTGKKIYPADKTAVNFSNPVTYGVVAEDGSAKYYTVICYVNAALYFSGADGNVYALDATTGDELWKHPVPGAVYSPTVDDETVYVAGGNGYLYALDTKTGAEQWKYPLGSYNSIPIVSEGIVYVSGGGYIYQINAVSGTLISRMYGSGINRTVFNKKIYVPRGIYGGMEAIDAASGTSLWSYGGNAICVSNPAIADGTLYVGNESYTLAALDANTGTVKWQVGRDGDNGGGAGAPTYCNGAVYIVNYRKELLSFDAKDGTIRWRIALGTFSSPVAYDDVVYISASRLVYAIDGATGNEKWRLSGSAYDENFTGCTYANGIVYVGSSNNYIYALKGSTGSLKWKHKINAAITSNICVVDVGNKAFHPGESGDQN